MRESRGGSRTLCSQGIAKTTTTNKQTKLNTVKEGGPSEEETVSFRIRRKFPLKFTVVEILREGLEKEEGSKRARRLLEVTVKKENGVTRDEGPLYRNKGRRCSRAHQLPS